MKKKTGIARLFEIAGERKGLLILSGILSAGSAACLYHIWQCIKY